MSRARRRVLPLALACALLAAAPGGAAEPEVLGTFEAWSAHLYEEGGNRTCYVYATPEKEEGDYTRRGPTYVQVSHRTSDGARNEVSVTAGYSYKTGSEVTIDIGGTEYTLFTRDDGAWAYDAKGDAALVAAMRAGLAMIVRGTSARGTLTTDTYSLSGFTAAHNAIGKACGIE